MNNKIIGIVLGILVLGVVIFTGMNDIQMSKNFNVQDKIKSIKLIDPSVFGESDWVDGHEFGPGNPGPNENIIDCKGRDSHEVMSLECATGWRSTDFNGETHWIC
ncbi:hypothetical protein HOD61_01425 [archaeon]|jgi:hypothetical protein|nr:hypothetical protein [archaeon]